MRGFYTAHARVESTAAMINALDTSAISVVKNNVHFACFSSFGQSYVPNCEWY